MRCRSASRYTSGHQTDAPSGQGKAARVQARLWPRTASHPGLGYMPAESRKESPSTTCSSWTLHVLVLAVDARRLCKPSVVSRLSVQERKRRCAATGRTSSLLCDAPCGRPWLAARWCFGGPRTPPQGHG
jgi:hypothetical protein